MKASTKRAKDKIADDKKPKHLIDLIPERKLLQNKNIAKFLEQDKVKGMAIQEISVSDEEGESKSDDSFQFSTLVNSIFYSFALLFIYGTFVILVHQQYGMELESKDILSQSLSAAPSILVFVYFTLSMDKYKIANLLYITIASFFGCYFIHLNLHSPRLGVMKRTPGLITLWIYLIMLMDMRPALFNILCVGLFWLTDPFKTRW